jgi:hypothetical protein
MKPYQATETDTSHMNIIVSSYSPLKWVSLMNRGYVKCLTTKRYKFTKCTIIVYGKYVEIVSHLYYLPNNIATIKSKRIKWAKHVAPMGDIIHPYRPEYGGWY